MVPKDCRYTKEHEWVRLEGEEAVIGITEYAQSALGDIVFVELPKVGTRLEQMKTFGSVEAVKAVSDLYAPLTGEVAAVNAQIQSDPSVVNRSPHGDGWMMRLKVANPKELDALLGPEEYEKMVAEIDAGH
jgi:glycine cleavage system H protein